MLLVANVLEQHRKPMTEAERGLFPGIEKLNVPRSDIPAVTHVDYSARIQTVHMETNPRYHALIQRFNERTGCPVIVNTSFNVRGEPIVCTPQDAYRCFIWAQTWRCSLSAIVFCERKTRIQTLRKTTNPASILIETPCRSPELPHL